MEAASLALSIITLLDTCLTACRLFSAGKSATKDSESLILELLWQQSLLKTWAMKWGIEVDESSGEGGLVKKSPAVEELAEQLSEVNVELVIVERTLRSMRDLLMEGEELSERHVKEIDINDEGTLKDKKVLSMRVKAKDTWTRFRWVNTDQIRLSQVVASLKSHNESLSRIVPRRDISTPKSTKTAVLAQALAKLSELGLSIPKSPKAGADAGQLSEALEFISKINSVEEGPVQDISKDLCIREWRNAFSNFDEKTPDRQIVHFIKGHNKFRVEYDTLLEWKLYGKMSAAHQGLVHGLALERTDRLARLLALDPPEDLRVLQCVGYFDDVNSSRIGLLYRLPEEFTETPNETNVTTLENLLASKSIGPPLSDRFRLAYILARSVLKLHLFKWLHKDIRSENVIFIHRRIHAPSFGEPYLGSLGIARPDMANSISEAGVRGIIGKQYDQRIYIHPSYLEAESPYDFQTENRMKYHRAFDIYSLGCVLLEIGLWKPLISLGWTTSTGRSYNERVKWRKKLIKYAETHLGFMCGEAYRDVVLQCLRIEKGSGEEAEEGRKTKEFCFGAVGVLEGLRC